MKEEIYSTRDLSLASALITLNFELLSINYQYEGNRTMPVGYFAFNKTEALDDALKAYWNKQLAVEPITYSTNVRSLKSQIHNMYKSPLGVDNSK